MLRRIAGAAVAGTALLVAFGCGGGANDASVNSGAARERGVQAADGGVTTSVGAPGMRTVTYHGVQFDVPADWEVHDLAADPTTCVRFDVHAVYLGTPGADMSCPAGIVGRSDAVLVTPTDQAQGAAASGLGSGNDVAAATATGLQVQVAPDTATQHEVAADVPTAGVSVTLTYQDSDTTAQQILQSFRTGS